MKKLTLFAIILITLGGCKTSESNYKAAYDAAMSHRDESTGLTAAERTAIAREAAPAMTAVSATDSVPVKVMRLGYIGRSGVVPSYCVAAGEFRQKFNAEAMCKRLQGLGFADAFVASTVKESFVAVAGGAPTLPEAAPIYRKLSAATRLTSPYPLIIHVP